MIVSRCAKDCECVYNDWLRVMRFVHNSSRRHNHSGSDVLCGDLAHLLILWNQMRARRCVEWKVRCGAEFERGVQPGQQV